MNFTYITPTQLLRAHPDIEIPLTELQRRANRPDRPCGNCGQPAWKLGGVGLCFPCTTGEADASGDYELVPETSSEGEQNYEALYHELLFAVAKKFPGESRHDTALRYIRQSEAGEALNALDTYLAAGRDFCDRHCTWLDHHPDCEHSKEGNEG